MAAELRKNGPGLVLDASASPAVLALNGLIGALGRTMTARPEAPVPEQWHKAAPVLDWSSVPDRSIRVLFIDESVADVYIPWRAVEKKLVSANPVVVVFGWSRAGYGRFAKYLLPTAVYPEMADDAPTPVDSVEAMFRPAAPLAAPPAGMVNPAEFIAKAAGLAAGDALRERADAIHKAGRGTLVSYADGKKTAVKEIKPGDFWSALNAGACWVDEPAGKTQAPKFTLEAPAASAVETAGLPLVAVFAQPRLGVAPASPLMSKVHQESNLLLAPNYVALSPATAATAGVADGGSAKLQTAYGSCAVRVRIDAGLPPGLATIAPTPALLDVCAPGARVKVVQA